MARRPVSSGAGVAVEVERALLPIRRVQLEREEPQRELLEVVLPLARVEQVRHHRGVEIERPHVDAGRAVSPCISSLARCATSGGPVGAEQLAELGLDRRVAQVVAVDVHRVLGRAGDREPCSDGACAAIAVPARLDRVALAVRRDLAQVLHDLVGGAQRAHRRRRASRPSAWPRASSPIASSRRGYSVRNSSCSKRTRTVSWSQPPIRRSSGSTSRSRSVRSTDISRLWKHLVVELGRGSASASAAGRRGARRCLRGCRTR